MSPISGSDPVTTLEEIVLDARRIAELPSAPLDGNPGVTFKTLWKDSRDHSYAGLMRLETGAAVRAHTHRYSVHHAWITEGECIVRGERLGPGAYSFVPANVEHSIDRAGPEGCTFFYLYQRVSLD